MPYTIERRGSILALDVSAPKIENAPTILGDILNHLDDGGITEIHVSLDDEAWDNGWTVHVLSAFELNMGSRGIPVRILGRDARPEGPKPDDAN